jgi:hypothetical protein
MNLGHAPPGMGATRSSRLQTGPKAHENPTARKQTKSRRKQVDEQSHEAVGEVTVYFNPCRLVLPSAATQAAAHCAVATAGSADLARYNCSLTCSSCYAAFPGSCQSRGMSRWRSWVLAHRFCILWRPLPARRQQSAAASCGSVHRCHCRFGGHLRCPSGSRRTVTSPLVLSAARRLRRCSQGGRWLQDWRPASAIRYRPAASGACQSTTPDAGYCGWHQCPAREHAVAPITFARATHAANVPRPHPPPPDAHPRRRALT